MGTIILRGYIERDFLIADNFYQTQCTAHISPEEYENEKKNAERREKERQLHRERQERARHQEERQTLLKDLREHLERDFLIADNFYQTQCTAHISPEEYENEKKNAERREKERQERARHEKEKQILLKSLREHFRRGQDFLTAYDFYKTQCTAHISFKEYEAEKTNYVRSWAKDFLDPKAPEPDDEQAAAIGAVEGNVQVVARAGSGKTATLVNRALFLQEHCGVAHDEMLLLAFNRKAAEEIRQRLTSCLQDSIPHVRTFHALAHNLVHPEKVLFDEPDGEQSQSRALQDIIDHYLRDSNYYNKIRALMMEHFRSDWERIISGGRDKTPDALLRYRRSLTWESLDGKYVKSFGEKAIANFLFEHNIEYKYEQKFPWDGVNYRPDFTIENNHRVIIEYFGLKGDPDYDEMSEEKRSYWRKKPNWRLLEFSPNDLTSNEVEDFYTLLKRRLEACKIPCNRLSEQEIWKRIKHLRPIDRFTRVIVQFIKRCRKLSLTPEQLSEKVSNHDCNSDIEQRFLNLAQVFYESYLERFQATELQATGEEDFDGLVQKAVEMVAVGNTEFQYRSRKRSQIGDLAQIRYVLIDEYQDFSELFYRLMEAVREQNSRARFFCVGDDWQAIYGFAGSDLHFFQNFEQLFEDSRELHVATNYRSAKAIVNVGNTLMRGLGIRARTHKTMTGKAKIADLGTFEPTVQEKKENPGDNFTPAVLRLVHKIINDGKNVVLLSRKNSLPSIKGGINPFLSFLRSGLPSKLKEKVTISTVHKYKGLEKAVVIVLDAVPHCYPLLHPNLIFTRIFGDSIEHIVAEERRLFYVALTRAEEDLFILTETNNFSPFLEDLELSRLEWLDYPPTKHITIRVSNQDGRGTEPTKAIKHLLRSDNYRWHSKSKFWYSIRPIEGFSVREFINRAMWSKSADGIAVRFYDLENKAALYHVDRGQWSCIYDNI